MKKLFLAVALISFVGLSNVEAAPCDGEKCTKECTDKKHKKASTDKYIVFKAQTIFYLCSLNK